MAAEFAEEPRKNSEDPHALFDAVYGELKRIARRHLRAAGSPATLSTTELVHEPFLQLASGREGAWQGRAAFFAAGSRAMRWVLVDFARRRNAAKRGGAWRSVSLRDAEGSLQIELEQVLALDTALERLEAVDQRLHRIVELRFFGGVPSRTSPGCSARRRARWSGTGSRRAPFSCANSACPEPRGPGLTRREGLG